MKSYRAGINGPKSVGSGPGQARKNNKSRTEEILKNSDRIGSLGPMAVRGSLLQRSCEFINKLNTANRLATISQLKEIHLLLHDLEISRGLISEKLSPYDETKIELDKDQENFINRHNSHHMRWFSTTNGFLVCKYRFLNEVVSATFGDISSNQN